VTILRRPLRPPTLTPTCPTVTERIRHFSLPEIKSELPDNSLEADEDEGERRLCGLCARVERARAVVATTPGLTETLRVDWRTAAAFYARLGVIERTFRDGVPSYQIRKP